MKKQTMMVGTILLGTSLLGGLHAQAADGGTVTTNGVISFESSTDPVDPVDPTNPDDPIKPIDPTKPEDDPGTEGPLSIDYASSFIFGSQKITSTDQVYYAEPQSYHKVDASGKVIGETLKGPNYVQVSDNRGTESGWTLKVKQNGQFKAKNKGSELTGAVLTLKNGNVVTKSASAKPTATSEVNLNVEGEEVDLLKADSGAGAGTYLLDWGTDEATGAKSIALSVPGKTTKYKDTYTTTLTWTLSDVPGETV